MRCRTATLEDAPAIADLHARSWRFAYRGAYSDEYLDGPVNEERLAVWTQRLSEPAPDQFVVVAEDDGRIVGFACAFGTFIDNIHADPERHRQGIGTALISEVVRWCREHHPDGGLALHVLSANSRAQSFYKRLGAVDAGEAPTHNPHILPGVTARRYEWATLDAVKR